MKKTYNKNTFTDTPMDASVNSIFNNLDDQKLSSKQKINAIGKKAKSKFKPKEVEEDIEEEIEEFEDEESLDDGISDLEKLSEETLRNFRYKHKRNRVIIFLLSCFLSLAIAAIAVYMIIVKLKTNCNMYVYGANATYIINGIYTDEFRAPAGIQGNRILKLDVKLKIRESGKFKIRFIPKCYKKGVRLDNVLVLDCNFDLFYEGGDGYYYSYSTIMGKQTITLCAGVILDGEYNNNLTTDNFRLDFYTYLDEI